MSPPLARRLRRAAVQHERQARAASEAPGLRLSLSDLVRLHGEASVPALLLLMSLITVVPVAGAGSLLSFGLLALGWAWAIGRERFELHPRLGAVSLNERWSGRSLHALAWVYARANRWLRPRWQAWRHDHTRGLWGLWIAAMAFIIFLPLPLGNVLPSLSLVLLGLGWMFRDGIALIGAALAGSAAVAYTVSLGHIAVGVLQGAWAWVAG